MDKFLVNILGCGSATPSTIRHTSSQVIDFRDTLMMVDCGEGAQRQFRKFGLKFSRLRRIFISHLHGDHCLGLPGLLSTLALHGKNGEIELYLPAEGLKVFKDYMDFFLKDHPFDLKIIPIHGKGDVLVDDHAISVEAFKLYHRVPCYGFIFREKPKPRHINGEIVRFHGIPHHRLNDIREGADWISTDGTIIPNSLLTRPADKSLSYAYCSDTMFHPEVINAVRGVDVIYHEATYDSSLTQRAEERGHSTALQAATVAKEANAKVLIIGHYSHRYRSVDILLDEARTIFPTVIAAQEGLSINLPQLLNDD